jgi:uncharacterized protein (TIGR02757 family)
MAVTAATDRRLKDFLDKKVEEYNAPSFIAPDPVSIPHRFTKREDREIAGFFAAIFAWGNRTIIINKARQLMDLMDGAPHDFIRNHKEEDRQRLLHFKHRTFNDTDLLYFVHFLQHHYTHHQSLEEAFLLEGKFVSIEASLNHFNAYFFSLPHAPARTRKHIAAPFKGSTCKRLNMYLRWMVRKDNKGVDFGIWNNIPQASLICPIDVHVARVARKLGLLHRPSVDWLAALELTHALRQFDEKDPAKYDFALFGLGVGEKF